MNTIPEHLSGKSAEQIVADRRKRFEDQGRSTYLTEHHYIRILESLLTDAVRDALSCVSEDKRQSYLEHIEEYAHLGIDAEKRAVEFLNKVLPK